jgi:hypothetical protein
LACAHLRWQLEQTGVPFAPINCRLIVVAVAAFDWPFCWSRRICRRSSLAATDGAG